MSDDTQMHGRQIQFPDGRAVALFDLGGCFHVRLTRMDGEHTRISLSDEAMAALVYLYIKANGADSAFNEEGGVLEFGRNCA